MHPTRLLIGFAPFLVYTVLSGFVPIGWAALIALVCALAVVVATARGGLKTLPVVQAVLLAVIAVLGFVAPPALVDAVQTYGRGGLSLALGGFIVATAWFAPFTAQFARASVPSAQWRSPAFVDANRRLSLAWGGAILAIGACRIVGALVGGGLPIVTLLIDWVLPIAALYLAYSYTRRVASTAPARTSADRA